MSTKVNKIVLSVVIVLIFLGAGFYFIKQKDVKETDTYIKEEQTKNTPAIEITKEDLKETNFTGSMVRISGTSPLALSARAYVEARMAEFKESADEEVPAIRVEFGADNPSSNYTVDIDAKYLEGEKTDSIVISEYAYTGGANGNSTYKVFTASQTDGRILTLSDIVKKEKQSEFIELVKKELINWHPEGGSEPVVFPDIVQDLDFVHLVNWSLEKDSLTLYFSKYEVGPGVLGAFAFPIPLSKIESMLY